MNPSNQKKITPSLEYAANSQILPYEDFHELKSEFFETFQKNDLKLLSNVHELGIDEYSEINKFKANSKQITKENDHKTSQNRIDFQNYQNFQKNSFNEENISTNMSRNLANQAFKYNYNSNPFPKVIPEYSSNSFFEEYTQLSSNRNKPEELLSTYWGNRFDEYPGRMDSPSKQNKNLIDYEKIDKKTNIFLPEQEKIKNDEMMKLECPNKFHYNPEGPFLFSTPPNCKSRIKEEPEPFARNFNSTNIGLYKKHPNNAFSDYFNSSKKYYSQNNFETPWEYEPPFSYSREYSLNDSSYYDRNSRGLKYLTIKVKEIVCNKGVTTYKEVAEILLNVINSQERVRFQNEGEMNKFIQNIKRRAYDALTVLISCGVFVKDGKNVRTTANSSINFTVIKNMDKTKKELKDNLSNKVKTLERKRQYFKELFMKYLSINNIINRNKRALNSPFEIKLIKMNQNIENQQIYPFSQEEQNTMTFERKDENDDIHQKNQEKKEIISSYYQNQYIKFPFIVIDILDKVAINMNQEKTIMNLFSKSPMKIYGDVDILLKMEAYNQLPKDFPLIKLIPREIHQYLLHEIIQQVR